MAELSLTVKPEIIATLPVVFGLAAAIFSGLLIVTGVAKIRRPSDTARALAGTGLPNHKSVGMILGVTELAVGAGGLLIRSAFVMAIQGVVYAGFIGWLLLAKARKLPISSCGCLGTPDTPPYGGHFVVDVMAIYSSVAAAMELSSAVPPGGMGRAAAALTVAVGTFLCWVVIGDAARLHGARA